MCIDTAQRSVFSRDVLSNLIFSFSTTKRLAVFIAFVCVGLEHDTTKAVFTLGLYYDQIIIELNMKWVHIN